MPEVLGDPPSPRTALFWNGTAWQWARVDALGHLQIDALSTVMDPLAATEATLATLATQATLAAFAAAAATAANQATMITALQLIDNLVVALGGPGNARLIVRGEDQLFSFAGVLAVDIADNPSAADGYLDSPAVPAGEIWVATTTSCRDQTTAITRIVTQNFHNGVNYGLRDETRAFAIDERSTWSGHTYLDQGDVIRAYFFGALAGDTCEVELTGYRMTLET